MNNGHVFHRSTSQCPSVASRGECIFLIDAEGRRYIDACGGAAVSCLGHGNREVAAAVRAPSAEDVILEQAEQPDDQMSYGQVLTTLYDTDEDAGR